MPNAYVWRRWEARAVTIKLKADALMHDMMQALGEEHRTTDYMDNVIHACEDLLSNIDNCCANPALRQPVPPLPESADSGRG